MSVHQAPYRLLAKWVAEDPEAWIALGNFETGRLRRKLPQVTAPIYITGLARAGTTMLTEALALHPDVATHRYRDFPCLFTPYLWNRFLASFDWIAGNARPRERAHGDGILVTSKSPEAMEEMLWMAFFRHLHDESRPNLLDAETTNPAFERFYREHLQKMLLLRKRTRYASKANYNLTRIPYLLKQFPDARFILALRDPATHVWSLHRKHQLFVDRQRQNPATLAHMDRSGHYEFGLHRRLIHTGDDAAMADILACFARGEDLRGWAKYWTMIHRFIADKCMPLPQVCTVGQSGIRQQPERELRRLLDHCGLPAPDAFVQKAGRLFTTQSPMPIPPEALDIIGQETLPLENLGLAP